jgi:cytochrome c-type biogenesis protein CcmH/NrfG
LYRDARDPRALQTARQAYQIAPSRPEIADTYGWLLVENDKAAEGLSLLESASRGLPEDREVRYHLAAAYARSGDKQRAASMLTALLKTNETFASRASAEQLLGTLATR